MLGRLFRKPLTPAEVTAFEEAGRKQREAAANSSQHLGMRVGLPRDAAEYILRLEARIEQLERNVAALEGPPHVARIEKR
jgi:hypothetical protein